MRIEVGDALPGGFRFGTVVREPNMRVSAPLIVGEETVAYVEAGSLPELTGAALETIHKLREAS